MNGSGRANKGTYFACRLFGITGSALKKGPTYRRYQDWFLSNWDNPEFWVELEKRFVRSANERTRESVRAKLHKERNRYCGYDGFADPL